MSISVKNWKLQFKQLTLYIFLKSNIILGKILIKLIQLMYMAWAVLDFVMAGTGVNPN